MTSNLEKKYSNDNWQNSAQVAVALVHSPVLDKVGDTVATNITNFDIHDIARACRTFGVHKYYLVNQMREQLMFADRVIDHWKSGYGRRYNPMRSTALAPVKTVETVDQSLGDWGQDSIMIATAARDLEIVNSIKFKDLRERLQEDTEKRFLLLFGTGFGLHNSLLERCDYLLEPIKGGSQDDYRHLSVRSAVSICLDRLLGTW